MKTIAPFILLIGFLFTSCKEDVVNKVYNGNNKSAILDNMLSRRSIRKYTSQQVSKEKIDTIMRYSIYAPSAYNKQPWEIRVVQNKLWLDEVNKRYINTQVKSNKDSDFSIFHHAPTLIVIARDKNSVTSALDCGIILQNIMLSAHGIGLGTCPLVLMVPTLNFPENKDLLSALKIPDDYEAVVCISLGYPAENPPMKPRNSERIKIIE
ncbi:nitroreductase [Chryseobacterium sp. OSA05B]|uniref:nitroreductase n=1 Tax=Chryseobacterium sp. OSA05B TaxID=2862650 RepID=UPI001CC12DB5|nr:nitroreductase [Chryseobacterium sp. OSA05B]